MTQHKQIVSLMELMLGLTVQFIAWLNRLMIFDSSKQHYYFPLPDVRSHITENVTGD